jgi:hypothetical protein
VKATLWIAINVFRESVRDKVLYNLVVFAILMIGASYLIGQLTAGQDIKIIMDLGLSAIAVFGLFIAVFIGIQLVSKEVERRSIYSMLSKPIHRHQLVLGKYLGLVLTLAVNLAVMVIAFYVVLAYMQWMAPPAVLAALDGPGTRPPPAQGGGADFRSAGDRHGDCRVLFQFLQSDSFCIVHPRPLCGRSFQQRPEKLRPGDRFKGCPDDRPRLLLAAAEPRGV